MCHFSFDYNTIDKSGISNIHKHLVVKNNIKFWLIKQVFIALLSFSEPLASTYVSLNNEPSMIRTTFTGLKHVELNYYPFMISLDKCNGCWNAVNEVSATICVLREIK